MLDIKKKRIEAGVTQWKTALACKVSSQTIINWEKGISSPRAEHLKKMAKEFNCKEAELIGGKL